MSAPLAAPPVRRYLSGGFGLDLGDTYPIWCPDLTAVNAELTARGFEPVTALPGEDEST